MGQRVGILKNRFHQQNIELIFEKKLHKIYICKVCSLPKILVGISFLNTLREEKVVREFALLSGTIIKNSYLTINVNTSCVLVISLEGKLLLSLTI